MTPPPSYATCRYSGSNPSSLFHNSVKGKVIHPHENSLGDFALNEKGGALMVGFQVSTDQFILVWLWVCAPQGLWAGDHSGFQAWGGISKGGLWQSGFWVRFSLSPVEEGYYELLENSELRAERDPRNHLVQ